MYFGIDREDKLAGSHPVQKEAKTSTHPQSGLKIKAANAIFEPVPDSIVLAE